MPHKEWFIGREGKEYGPYSDAVMRLAAAQGKLQAQDLVWAQGMDDWRRADAVADFEPLVRPAPAAVPAVDSPPAAPAAPAIAHSRTNYLARHWRGDFSLAQAYWVNNFGINLVWVIATASIAASGITNGFGLRATGLWTLGAIIAGVILTVWSAVGVWRSAREHTARGGNTVWAGLAMLLVVLGCLRLIGTEITQAPIIAQSFNLAIGLDTMPPAELRVVNRATEVEIAGGLSDGTAERLKTILDATPTVRLLQLNNVGGWIQEGAKLGALVAERHLSTYTARECDSSCLIVFMAGEERLLGSKAKLGFHEASVAGVGGSVAQQGSDVMRHSLEQHAIPEAFISHALSTPASSMWYPTTQELLRAHVITAVVDEHAFGETGITGWRNRTTLERDFAAVPLFAAISDAEPKIYARLKTRYVSDVEAGVPQNEMIGRMHAVLVDEIVPKYLQHGPDAPLMNFWHTQLAEMRELRAIDPKDCAAFLFPAPTDSVRLVGLLSQKVTNEESARLTELIRATSENPAPTASQAEVQPALVKVARSTNQRIPGALQLIVKEAHQGSTHPAALCDDSLAFYGEILSLSPSEAGPLLRYLAAAE